MEATGVDVEDIFVTAAEVEVDGVTVSEVVGEVVAELVGVTVFEVDGEVVTELVGVTVSEADGEAVTELVGVTVSVVDGETLITMKSAELETMPLVVMMKKLAVASRVEELY